MNKFVKTKPEGIANLFNIVLEVCPRCDYFKYNLGKKQLHPSCFHDFDIEPNIPTKISTNKVIISAGP